MNQTIQKQKFYTTQLLLAWMIQIQNIYSEYSNFGDAAQMILKGGSGSL